LSLIEDRHNYILSELKQTLSLITESIFSDYLGIEVSSAADIEASDVNSVGGNIISAQITFSSEIIGSIILTVENRLARYIVKHMGLEILSDEEEKELVVDSLGELLNVIAGNATDTLFEKNINIDIDTPTPVDFKSESLLKKVDFEYARRLETTEGMCYLIIIHS